MARRPQYFLQWSKRIRPQCYQRDAVGARLRMEVRALLAKSMNNLSPNDPLYWFKNLPKETAVLVQLYDDSFMELPKDYKFRIMDLSEEITAFCKINGVAFCEVVGGTNCGLRFYLSGNGVNEMEPAD